MEKKCSTVKNTLTLNTIKIRTTKFSDSDIRANHLLEALLVLPNTIKIKVCNRDRTEDNSPIF
ncbi:unnamed protein product [Gulo gulo]|uniref:Uncharacterized protein n=1 Tax=Gulo gulo TaxID=48420 RepID=A0A9X9LYS7_GULGU|nr:unnamed protein product [Gulo gulo]